MRAGRPRSVFCLSEKARQRASRRGGALPVPGMNAGPKTVCGGKRPSTGVFAQPFAGDLRGIRQHSTSASRSSVESRPAVWVWRAV